MVDLQELVALRREFHHYAEPKWTEFRTSSRITQFLLDLGIEVLLGGDICEFHMGFGMPDKATVEKEIERAISQGADPELVARMQGHPGVVGIVETGRPGPVVAMRFDIDALPFEESHDENQRAVKEGFVSLNPCGDHACGHDGHTAIGLGVAKALMEIRGDLNGTIKLIFQPAEEGGGGARGIVARGLLDDVDYAFASHLCLDYKDGTPIRSHELGCGAKDFMDHRRYVINFIGHGAHPASDPQNGRNALLAACQAALGIHGIAPSSEGTMRVNVGILKAGVSRNTVAPNAYMEAEVRGNNDKVSAYADGKLRSLVAGAAAMYEADFTLDCIGHTVAGASDDAAIDIVEKCAAQVPWFQKIKRECSIGGTDDMSDMLRQVQSHGGIGVYFGLGANKTTSVHNNRFDFDESVLAPAVELYTKIAYEVMGTTT